MLSSEDQDIGKGMTGGAEVFARSQDANARLEDFKVLKIVGKGTFGKVYLVENAQFPGKLYAMKCIRKDVVLENEQMENI